MGLALAIAACGKASSHSVSRPAPGADAGASTSAGHTSTGARNSFQASVTSATGVYSGEGGRAQVLLQIRGSGPRRATKLVFRSLPCQGAPQCVQLDGVLTGVITARPGPVPDAGRSFVIAATGRLTTLGHVRATGIGHGTGFIARGHELLDLTLSGHAGRLGLRALSGSVGGFSSP